VPTIEEQIERLEALENFVETQLPVYARQVLANDLVSLVTNRVVQRGENFKGTFFSSYSSKTIAAFRFWGKSRNQTAERKVRALSRAKGVLSYKDFREINNLKSSKKNFEFTGEMWRKFGVIRVETDTNSFSVKIGGTTTASQNKIDDNSEREGISIIEANDFERKLAEKGTSTWIETNAERILNG